MTLAPIRLEYEDSEIPEHVLRLLDTANQRIDRFLDEGGAGTHPGFVPADYECTYRALSSIVAYRLATGNRFCEWGSGFGVVAMLGSALGLESYGIEIESQLVKESRQLAAACSLRVEFVEGSFVPTGSEDVVDRVQPDKFSWLMPGGVDGHEELEMDVEDFDIIFAYPWPGEESVIDRLFSRKAADGALLLTYHGDDGIRAQRKLPRRRRPSR